MGLFDVFRPQKKEPAPDAPPPVNTAQDPDRKEAGVFAAKAFSLMHQGFLSGSQDLVSEALRNVNKALDLDPDCYDALEYKTSILGRLPKEDKSHCGEALACCERAIALKKDTSSMWFSKAGILEQLGRDEEALEAYEKSYALEPTGYQAGMARVASGGLLEKMGRDDDALRLYGAVLPTDTSYGEAVGAKARIMERKGRWDETLAGYRAAAREFDRQEDFRDEVASFDHVLALDPADNYALFRKGVALWSQFLQTHEADLLARAEASLDTALVHDPKNAAILTAKGVCLLENNNFGGSLQYFDRALAQSPADKSALGYKGLVLWRLTRHDEALAVLDQLCEQDPESPLHWFAKAVIRSEQGDNEQGLKDIDLAIRCSEQHHPSWELRAAFLRSLDRHAEAEEAEDKAKRYRAR